jgi:signal transduction histidine kinase
VDLSEVTRQCIENVKVEAQNRDISIQLDVPEGSSMEADRTEIEMIFNNLISNAVKYNRDHGRVSIAVQILGDEVKIQVEDTGIGMTQDECQRLFSDFSRIKNEKTRHILGSGLGLSTLKKLATIYNGDISVISQPDAGSTFFVSLRRNVQPVLS